MDRIQGLIKRIRKQKRDSQDLEVKTKPIDLILRDHFEAFLDLLYKKDIDQYPKIKELIRDYTRLSSALIQGDRETVLDYLLFRMFPGFLFKLVDKSLHESLVQPIKTLKIQVNEVWEAYNGNHLEELAEPDSPGYIAHYISEEEDKSSVKEEKEKKEDEDE